MQKNADINKALELKYPEQVVLVTTRSKAGHANVMAVGWIAVASSDPAMFVLGIDDEAYTYRLINETKEFVVAFPSDRMAEETLHAGTIHGHDREKIKEAGITAQDAKVVKAPLVADAVANFECELVEITRPGDCPLVIGKVVAAHVNTDSSPGRLYTVGPGHRLAGVSPAGKEQPR